MTRYPAKPPLEPGDTNTYDIEIEPGVWVDYLEWQVAQSRERRWWEGQSVREEDKQANIRRLREIVAENFGRRE